MLKGPVISYCSVVAAPWKWLVKVSAAPSVPLPCLCKMQPEVTWFMLFLSVFTVPSLRVCEKNFYCYGQIKWDEPFCHGWTMLHCMKTKKRGIVAVSVSFRSACWGEQRCCPGGGVNGWQSKAFVLNVALPTQVPHSKFQHLQAFTAEEASL